MVVIDPPRRYYSVFMGSCVFADAIARVNSFITKKEYDE